MLNVSVDIADPNSPFTPEDLSINDQESIIEIIVEKIFGFENAISEYDDHDTEEQNGKKSTTIDFLSVPIADLLISSFNNSSKKKEFPHYEAALIQRFEGLDSPPPKV